MAKAPIRLTGPQLIECLHRYEAGAWAMETEIFVRAVEHRDSELMTFLLKRCEARAAAYG